MESSEEQVFKTGASRSKLEHHRFDLVSPFAWFYDAARYGLGARKRGDNNWRKGMPYSAIVNHMMRHLMLYVMGDRSDDHLGAVRWGAAALIEQDITHPDMNDLYAFPPEAIAKFKAMLDVADAQGEPVFAKCLASLDDIADARKAIDEAGR
jgi:hypothetical protein